MELNLANISSISISSSPSILDKVSYIKINELFPNRGMERYEMTIKEGIDLLKSKKGGKNQSQKGGGDPSKSVALIIILFLMMMNLGLSASLLKEKDIREQNKELLSVCQSNDFVCEAQVISGIDFRDIAKGPFDLQWVCFQKRNRCRV